MAISKILPLPKIVPSVYFSVFFLLHVVFYALSNSNFANIIIKIDTFDINRSDRTCLISFKSGMLDLLINSILKNTASNKGKDN